MTRDLDSHLAVLQHMMFLMFPKESLHVGSIDVQCFRFCSATTKITQFMM